VTSVSDYEREVLSEEEKDMRHLKGLTGDQATKTQTRSASTPKKAPDRLTKATLKGTGDKQANLPKNLGSMIDKPPAKTPKSKPAPAVDDEVEELAAKLEVKFGISRDEARKQILGLKTGKAQGKLKRAAAKPKPKQTSAPAHETAPPAGLDLGSLAGGLGALFGLGGAGASAPQPGGDDPLSGLLGMLGGQGMNMGSGGLEGMASQLMDQLGIEPEDALNLVMDWVKRL